VPLVSRRTTGSSTGLKFWFEDCDENPPEDSRSDSSTDWAADIGSRLSSGLKFELNGSNRDVDKPGRSVFDRSTSVLSSGGLIPEVLPTSVDEAPGVVTNGFVDEAPAPPGAPFPFGVTCRLADPLAPSALCAPLWKPPVEPTA
jgi:hypothetical protein